MTEKEIDANQTEAIAKSKTVRERYDQTAEWYDDRYRSLQEQKYKAMLGDLEGADLLLDLSVNGRRVLIDIGCGTCMFFTFLDDHWSFPCHARVGIDISDGMLSVAKERLLGHRGRARALVSLVNASASWVPLRGGVASVASSFSTMQNLEAGEWSRFLEGCASILAESAPFLLSYLEKPPLRGKGEWVEERLRSLFTSVSFLDWHRMEDQAFLAVK